MGQTSASYLGEQRRRSLRIAQSVALTVRGVDLLGQPFEERTATLVLNYHGCKYPSKHHLPKNTWITLEIPQTNSDRGRRCMRARVAWIQRPRTVRELFQIGVELENAGNVWEIDVPPEDWGANAAAAGSSPGAGGNLQRTGVTSGGEIDAPGGSGLPAPVTVFMERMMQDAKQHSQSAAAGTAVYPALDADSPLLRELNAQMERQAEKAVEGAAVQARESIRRAAEEIEREHRASVEALHEKRKQEIEALRKETSEQLASELSSLVNEAQQTERTRFSRELEARLSETRDLLAELGGRAETLHAEIEGAAHSTAARFEQLRTEMSVAEAALRQRPEAQEAKPAPHEETIAAWREDLQAEMAVARAQWNELLQSSLDNAVSRLVSKFGESSSNAVAGAEQKMAARLSELSQPLADKASAAQETLTGVSTALELEVTRARTSLGEIEQAANRMSEYSAQMEAASQDTVSELHRRLETILASQSAELNRRAETLAARLTERMGATLESSGQQVVTRTLTELEAKFDAQVERAQDLLRQLTAREEQAEETLRVHRERLRQASEQNQRDATGQMKATLAQLKGDFETVRREALVKWNDELDASGVRATHAALESLTKASSWYQQKTQADVQAIIDEALVKAAGTVGETTAEAGRQFAADLDTQRAQSADEAKKILDTVSVDSVSRTRIQLEQASENTARAFSNVLDGISDQAVQRFTETSLHSLEERTMQLRSIAEEIRRHLEAQAVEVLAGQQTRLETQVKESSGEARKLLEGQLATTMEAFRILRDGQQREHVGTLERLGGEWSKHHEEKLRAIGDNWLENSVHKLAEHGQDAVESIARTAEQTLRITCSRVFDGLAEAMREKMLGATDSATAPPPTEKTGKAEKSARA